MRGNELIHSWKELSKDTNASTLLLLLLGADCAFVFLHFLPLAPLFSLEKDFGYPEIYQYIKEMWIVGLLLSMLIRIKNTRLRYMGSTILILTA